ncbi:MAG: saccharopine dehydrogenase NADP-binding domain-containing protein, partial [Bacteroidetes bacterium]|nr:saccharopine dehydrogenase NADP-binding domain-containing protein [Bacteroidota bacterium]
MKKILVIGMGKVGSLVGTLLSKQFDVTGLDKAQPAVALSFPVQLGDVTDSSALRQNMEGFDAVVSCMPYNLNLPIAKTAYELGIHYFDLTEDVPTTAAIREMAKDSKGVMAPQCGLAPGFIGIVGASLAQKFTKLRDIELRVGALPRYPNGLMGYSFTWSPAGVINEYINDAE